MRLAILLTLTASVAWAQPQFDRQVLDNNVAIGYGLAIGDVDGDGKSDILLADKKQFVWYRNGDWKRFALVENLTKSDNVCIAARDIDGDGKVEIAVGAQWNPGETSDTTASGSVHYLVRPAVATSMWSAQKLHHEPTVHRMKWVKVAPNDFRLIVVPLHGRGNKNGEGSGVRVIAYKPPVKGKKEWTYEVINQLMHLTHNFDIVTPDDRPEGTGEVGEHIALGGKEGIRILGYEKKSWAMSTTTMVKDYGIGEVRWGVNKKAPDGRVGYFLAAIEPMHGSKVTVHLQDNNVDPDRSRRIVLDSTYNEGHALACEDVLGTGQDQVIAGWRLPDKNGKVGIKIFAPTDGNLAEWKSYWLDEGGIACEDLVVADLNGDKKLDVIAAGRASKNLIVYWNQKK